jgi:hypothetical protein
MELEAWRLWWRRKGERELGVLLMETWDPIGVAGMPETADEYDNYIGPIGRKLREGATQDDLARHLASVRGEYMGLGADDDADREVAREIVAWYQASTERLAG